MTPEHAISVAEYMATMTRCRQSIVCTGASIEVMDTTRAVAGGYRILETVRPAGSEYVEV